MAWLYLVLAGLSEIGWVIGLKYTEGFSRPLPTILTVLSMIISLALLSFALRGLPLGTAYAIWTGMGTVGAVMAGAILFDDSITVIRIACIALIIAGMVGLKVTS